MTNNLVTLITNNREFAELTLRTFPSGIELDDCTGLIRENAPSFQLRKLSYGVLAPYLDFRDTELASDVEYRVADEELKTIRLRIDGKTSKTTEEIKTTLKGLGIFEN